jgi:hypothetical protein
MELNNLDLSNIDTVYVPLAFKYPISIPLNEDTKKLIKYEDASDLLRSIGNYPSNKLKEIRRSLIIISEDYGKGELYYCLERIASFSMTGFIAKLNDDDLLRWLNELKYVSIKHLGDNQYVVKNALLETI